MLLCVVCLVVAGSVVYVGAQERAPRIAARPTGGRYQLQTVSQGGEVRHFACDTTTGQLYCLRSRNVGLPQPEYFWETLGPRTGD